MVVLVLERVPVSLRGELSRWFLELRAGVFVGEANTLVRELVWEEVCQKTDSGSAVLIYRVDNEQGFGFRLWGAPSYYPEEFEGLLLMRKPQIRKREAAKKRKTQQSESGSI